MISLDVVGIVRVEEADLVESSVAKRGITIALRSTGQVGPSCQANQGQKNAKWKWTAEQSVSLSGEFSLFYEVAKPYSCG